MTDPARRSTRTRRKRTERVTGTDVQDREQPSDQRESDRDPARCGDQDVPQAPDVQVDEGVARDGAEHQDASPRRVRRAPPHQDRGTNAAAGVPSLIAMVEGDLRTGGILSKKLPGYEERPAQIAMARTVAAALEAGEHAAVEASTGTGKSFAYLLALARSGKVALVSTANKALQEQLFYKDIPFVQRHVQDFQAALVKGMGNYLCMDRLNEEQRAPQLFGDPAFERMLELVEGDAHGTGWDGDLDLLPLSLSAHSRARVAADSDQCAWHSCPFFGDCYVRKMRQRAEDAQVIVVNHTLLLLDAAMDNWLLPSRDVVILDEAHHLEEEATRAFTVTVTPGRVQSLLALRRVSEHSDGQLIQDAAAASAEVWSALDRRVTLGPRGRATLTQPVEEGLRLASLLDELASSLQRNRPQTVDVKEEQLYEKVVKRARTLSVEVRTAFAVADPAATVYYAERTDQRGVFLPLSVSATPLGVSDLLGDKLFHKVPVIATSATLAIGGDFAFFRHRVGLPVPPATREAVLPLAFDFPTHALLYVPRLRHEPAFGAGGEAYHGELAEQMRQLVEASRGRAFLLFSSQRALAAVRDQIADGLAEQGCTVLVQGAGASRVELVRRFRTAPRPVLFGLKSFWEGVDIAGETLSLVAVDKLPFAPPDDPIQEARVARMKAAGENWFGGYTLPLAILQLKQGLGRLLRTREDRGVMAILDTRLHTKSYGRQVLAALPPARRTLDIASVRAFFADGRDEDI